VTPDWLPAFAAFGVSAVATGLVLLVGRRWRVVDVPNERSAHDRPTPTLGGLGILAGLVAALLLAPASPLRTPLLICVGLLLISVVDDTGRPLGVRAKLVLQLLVALAWVTLAPADALMVSASWSIGGLPAAGLSVLWLVAMMNAYNFMDGIDGLTASQAMAMMASLSLLLAGAGVSLPALVAAASAGFLLYNLPPARLFMGDVGSLSLGFLVGVCVLRAASATPVWVAALPVAAYAVDTATTLWERRRRGQRLGAAHREHLYQRLVQSGWSHGRVDLAALAVTGLFGAGALWLARGSEAAGWLCVGLASTVLLLGLRWKGRLRA
jgi:UDP-N-acetylmuramyl pentapeptide phosphotransferase/UDP-N-acetylglucosamine-1-phosphate transferase